MDASDRITDEYNRMVAMGRTHVADLSYAERIVCVVVMTRCEIDMEGFESVYEQALNASEVSILIDGLTGLGEEKLASEFARGYQLLRQEGFYDHLTWYKISLSTQSEIVEIGRRIGDQLWDLDEKLVALLDLERAGPG